MHWIEQWRRANGLSRRALAKRVRCLGGGCSEGLIDLLENQNNAVTHPRIAARIAAVTGATERQWGSIVPKAYRREYKMYRVQYAPGKRLEARIGREHTGGERAPTPKQDDAPRRERVWAPGTPYCPRPVVELRPDGSEVRRYKSIYAACMANEICDKTVWRRCNGRIHGRNGIIDEFRQTGTTFRYAEEWDAMSPARRAAEIRRAAGRTEEERKNGRKN